MPVLTDSESPVPPPSSPSPPPSTNGSATQANKTGQDWSLYFLTALLISVVAFRNFLVELTNTPLLQTLATVFVSIVIQAMPFLVFGVVLSSIIAVYVPASFFSKVVPRNPAVAVPVSALSGAVLPGCECASVPVSASLIKRGVTPAAALAFLLAAPAINPVVLVSTAIAFPNRPDMVAARFVASLVASVIVGWLWLKFGKDTWFRPNTHHHDEGVSRFVALWMSIRHDVVHAGGFLVVGGLAAAAVNVLVPSPWLRMLADHPVLSIGALALLAVVLSICSEADAFVAASLSQFSLTSRLVFLVVGPMIDLKLAAMQIGTFGVRFAIRFAPLTFVVATASAVTVAAIFDLGWSM